MKRVPENFAEYLGLALQAKRKAQGLSQGALQAKAGIASLSTVSRIENGQVPVTVETYLAVTNALGIAKPGAWLDRKRMQWEKEAP